MNVAEAVAVTLEAAGVQYAFGLVGTTTLSILDSLAGTDVEYVSTRHEQVAASMAVGYALASRTPSVSISHVGPGAANQIIGIAAAYRDDVPVISITGNEPSTLLGREVNHEWDVMGVFERFSKHNVQLTRADAHAQVRNAIMRTITGMPGPVHVDVPKDIADADIETDERGLNRLRNAKPVNTPIRARPDPDVIARTVELLSNAERPILIAGSEFRWFGGEPELRRLATLLELPIATAQNARGALSERDPRSLGYVANSGLAAANEYFERADLIIGVGTTFSEKVTDGWRLLDTDAPIVQATMRADELNRYVVADVGTIADPQSFLADLVAAIEASEADLGFEDIADDARTAYETERQAALEPDPEAGPGIDPRLVLRAIDERLGSFSYTTGGGVHNRYPRMLPVEDLNGRFVTANFTGMSQGLPLAMGAKLALDRPVLVFEGDGGFAMVMQDLETVVRHDIPLKICIFNNDAYMSHAVRQRERYGGRYIGTKHSNPDFGAVARNFDLAGGRLVEREDVSDAVDTWLSVDGPALLEVAVDPDVGAASYV